MPCSTTFSADVRVHAACGTHWGNITISFILLAAPRDGRKEGNVPRDAHFGPHFQVYRAKTRVEASTHEHVIDEVPRHPQLVTSRNSDKVHQERYRKTVNHGHSHQMTVIINDPGETEDSVIVQDSRHNKGCVKATDSVAIIHEGLMTQRWHGKTLLHISWHNVC
jgi:hypothetical protein